MMGQGGVTLCQYLPLFQGSTLRRHSVRRECSLPLYHHNPYCFADNALSGESAAAYNNTGGFFVLFFF